ncbi:hypothetical protein T4C_7840 [Trichinella pseudospiralis]|uniref:Uncharacterized protein n=1 Tax=Trichinella pseudospiralis TaxID=6337 RepID=A0A0V1JUF9_TRIPS|nr:hypothetical protein T4C_7840 [Trichinella pseudospiralis]
MDDADKEKSFLGNFEISWAIHLVVLPKMAKNVFSEFGILKKFRLSKFAVSSSVEGESLIGNTTTLVAISTAPTMQIRPRSHEQSRVSDSDHIDKNVCPSQ